MFREGSDPEAMLPSDVLCDLCASPWNGTIAMIEGHHGSAVCGGCLSLAYIDVVLHNNPSHKAGESDPFTCVLCLEEREDDGWESPKRAASVCKRCMKQAASALDRSDDYEWKKPRIER